MKKILLALLLLSVFACDKEPESGSTPTIELSVSKTTISVGDSVAFTISADDIDDIFGMSFRLSYNSNLLLANIGSNWIGDLWSNDAIGLFENENDIVYVSITQVRGNNSVSGSGIIGTFSLEGLSSGTSTLSIIKDDLVFYDEDGDEISVSGLELFDTEIIVQ